ncbi:SDR family NAD(P)-dependent oxidoreductase [Rhodococcus erythropolis]|uniref:SDR family NAD(P)-dependent oxidoreductase n=1 Tax=Rhodococcus erythropolis TaxID=1833 RepID=UPI002226D1F7|nr:SDR family oxidoreductase [Rhodococcus erythropolis]MCW2295440.1 NAD(P)-dependent dehydrogenase (short-subunit alcohol dehydrogenase family) [Rhodococcus erythropolis]
MRSRLAGKVAVITGGVSGMGLASAELFTSEGASVVIADIQDDKGRDLEKRLGDQVRYVHCNVMEESDIESAVATAVSEFGGLDVMYHNAGAVGDNTGLDEISVEGWDRTQSLLLRSSMLTVKHAVGPLRERGGGSIILTSSAAAVALGGSGPYAYTVAKAGIITLGKFAALDLGKHKIRVNTIIPGGFATSIWSGHVGGDAAMGDAMAASMSGFEAMQPIPRAGDTRDIAETALWLSSDHSSFVTGTAIPVDGGLTLFRGGGGSAAEQLGDVQRAAAGK